MAMLAQALETAGCDDGSGLSHCRTQANHVRGWWVVDAVLGKQGIKEGWRESRHESKLANSFTARKF
jgi:hypothetical protein